MTADEPSAAEQAQRDWEALRSVGELFPGTPLEESSKELEEQGGWPEDLTGTPIVLADPDEPTLIAASRSGTDLTLVVTSMADAARATLTRIGRDDVTVVGPQDAAEALTDVTSATDRPIRWIGAGRPDALLALLDNGFQQLDRLRVTQLQVGNGAAALLAAVGSERLSLDLVTANPDDGDVAATVAVAAAQLMPFVDFRKVPAAADSSDHVQPAKDGVPVWWGVSEPGALRQWLTPLLEG